MTPTIALLGDVMLGRAVAERLAEVPPEEVWAPEVRELCRACDLVICNLECCISVRGEPTERVRHKPFFFRGPPQAVGSLEAIGAGAVSLANNHALDYEAEALVETLDLLGRGRDRRRRGGPWRVRGAPRRRSSRPEAAGSGWWPSPTTRASSRPAGTRRGSPTATCGEAIPDWVAGELARLARECDHVVAFPHWGPNMTTEPAGWQRRAAEQLQEAGADLVAGHSAHVFHGAGWGRRGPLLYDLGDALDDYAVDPRLRNDLGVLAIWRPGDPELELELVGLALDHCRTRLAAGDEAEWIAQRLTHACEPLGTRVERIAEERFRVVPLKPPRS